MAERGAMALIGWDAGDTRRLAAGLGAQLVPVPAERSDAAWQDWRAALAARPRVDKVVVALFPDWHGHAPVVRLATDEWTVRGEIALLYWMTALGGAAELCADGGTIVAVVDSPPPLDSAGFAPEAGVAEAVEALTRSLALSEGKRGVRANTVTTPCRLLHEPPIAPIPPLPGFPGTLEEDVVGTVRLLLSPDAAYLSGRCIPADRGRSW